MPVDEHTRHALHEAVRMTLGDEHADTLMELLPPVGWADIATKEALSGTERRLDAKVDAVGARLDAKIDAVEARLDAKIDAVEARLDAKIDALGQRLDVKVDGTSGILLQHIELVAERQTVRFLRWTVAMWATGVAVVATITRLAA